MDLIPKRSVPMPAIDTLATIPESSIWLANFTSPRTRKNYAAGIKEFIDFIGLQTESDWKKVGQAHVIAWRDRKIQEGASSQTINTRLSALSSLFKHLCEKQTVNRNPVDGVKRARVAKDRVQTQVITPSQVRDIIDAPDQSTLKGCRDKAILCTLFYTGCRIAEVCRLKVRDYYQDSGYWVLDFIIKGGKRNRIAINQELRLVLDAYLNEAGHGGEPESPLILAIQRSELRWHLDPSQVNRIFHAYAKAVALPKGVTPHTARATFITQALENRCAIEAVQRSVGHANISTTQMYDKRLVNHRESASFAVRY